MSEPIHLDPRNPHEATMITFAGAWLNAIVSGYNAENVQRNIHGQAMAYVADSFHVAARDAIQFALTGKVPDGY